MRQPFRKASVYIALLLILQAITGLLIILVTAYYQSVLSTYLEVLQGRLLFSYLFNVYIFGAELVVTYLCSLSLWNRLWKRRCTPNVRLMLSIWLFYSCVIIVSGFGVVWNLYYNIDVLENTAENSLLHGIDSYYSSPEWKLLWDGLQLRKGCCGVHDYKDWMKAEWMPGRRKDTASRLVMAPVACFKRSHDLMHNYNTYKQQEEQEYSHRSSNHRRHVTPTIDAINTSGCIGLFSDAIWKYFYILLLFVLMALKFLIFLCCLTKYILQRQHLGEGSEGGGMVDEEGCPLVMVKYPRNVRCVMIGEDDLASDMAPDNTYCNCVEAPGESCDCCTN